MGEFSEDDPPEKLIPDEELVVDKIEEIDDTMEHDLGIVEASEKGQETAEESQQESDNQQEERRESSSESGSDEGKEKQEEPKKKKRKMEVEPKEESEIDEPPHPTEHPRKKRRRTMTQKAGLQFSVRRFQRKLKDMHLSGISRIRAGAPVYLTAALEFLMAELLQISVEILHKDSKKRKRITPRDMMRAIKGDREFDELLASVIIPEAGRPSFVHKELLQRRGK